MYCDDHNARVPPNMGNIGDDRSRQTWANGWLDFTTSSDNTNIAYLMDPGVMGPGTAVLLGPYVRNPKVFKCPADRSAVTMCLGWTQGEPGSQRFHEQLGWRQGVERRPQNFVLVGKTTQMVAPARIWVLIDERGKTASTTRLLSLILPTQGVLTPSWITRPATMSVLAGLNFADGHSEIHRWLDPKNQTGDQGRRNCCCWGFPLQTMRT